MSPCRAALLLFLCVRQVCCRDESVTVYQGQSVILKSGVDGRWNLTKAQWYIYKNTTYIASLRDGLVVLFEVLRYKGRLDLNKTTGDLTINNVTLDDSMIYSVDLVNSNNDRAQVKVNLTVHERLKKPVVQRLMRSLQGGQCYVGLSCNAFGQNVTLSWTPDGDFNGTHVSGTPNPADALSVLYLSFSGNTNATFNCSASSGQQTETQRITVGCSENASMKCEDSTVCSSYTSCFFWGVFTAVSIGVLFLAFKKKESIKVFCCSLVENVMARLR